MQTEQANTTTFSKLPCPVEKMVLRWLEADIQRAGPLAASALCGASADRQGQRIELVPDLQRVVAAKLSQKDLRPLSALWYRRLSTPMRSTIADKAARSFSLTPPPPGRDWGTHFAVLTGRQPCGVASLSQADCLVAGLLEGSAAPQKVLAFSAEPQVVKLALQMWIQERKNSAASTNISGESFATTSQNDGCPKFLEDEFVDQFRDDEVIMGMATDIYAMGMSKASERLRGRESFLTLAVGTFGFEFYGHFLPAAFSNKQTAKVLVKRGSHWVGQLSLSLRDDTDLMSLAVALWGYSAYISASQRLQNSKEVVLAVLDHQETLYPFCQQIPRFLQNDLDVLRKMIRRFPVCFSNLSQDHRSDPILARILIESGGAELFFSLGRSLRADRDIAYSAIAVHPSSILDVEPALQGDFELVRLALSGHPWLARELPESTVAQALSGQENVEEFFRHYRGSAEKLRYLRQYFDVSLPVLMAAVRR